MSPVASLAAYRARRATAPHSCCRCARNAVPAPGMCRWCIAETEYAATLSQRSRKRIADWNANSCAACGHELDGAMAFTSLGDAVHPGCER